MFRTNKTYTTPMMLFVPTYEKEKGVAIKKYPDRGQVVFCSFKTYGGTETTVNGVYSIEDTATIETWYRPDINSGCRLTSVGGAIYEIINEPENVEMRNQTLIFKVRRVKGGA